MKFNELLWKVRKNPTLWTPPKRLLALDPGENTGYAVFRDGIFCDCGQQDCKEIAPQALTEIFDKYNPTHVIAEDYRIYQHKTDSHTWSNLFTPRLLGMIELLCYQREINLDWQMASAHKSFCTDMKLKEWDFWQTGMRHSRDAIRAGCYYLLFNKRS